jgi:hypothetical protein
VSGQETSDQPGAITYSSEFFYIKRFNTRMYS